MSFWACGRGCGASWPSFGSKMEPETRAPKAILAQVEVAMGSQRLSMGRCWEDFHNLLCAIWYFGMCSVRKGWCILCYKGVVYLLGCFSHSPLFAFHFRRCLRVARWQEPPRLGLVCCDWSGLLTCGLVSICDLVFLVWFLMVRTVSAD